MKRLGIFVFYDKAGIVDRYVEYLLQGMQEHIDELVIVCNGWISEDGLKCLKVYTSHIHIRENSGYDVAAFRNAFIDYVGWENLNKYDEIVIWNDTFFGPIYPFQEMFDIMENKKLDFWGMTESTIKTVSYPHIQTYFMVFSNKVIAHPEFHKYWEDLTPDFWSYEDVIIKHEVEFTQFVERLGFKWDVYIPGEGDLIQYLFTPFTMIREYRYPVVKRKAFVYTELERAPYGELPQLLRFLDESYLYDTDMILENIIRIYNLQLLSDVLRWQYHIRENEIIEMTLDLEADILIILVIMNDRWEEDIIKYIPKGIHIEIVRESSLKPATSMISIIRQLIEIKKPKFVCILCDFVFGNQKDSLFVTKSKLLYRFRNLLGSTEIIKGIINLFIKNRRLAYLVSPPFYYGLNSRMLGDNWGEEYDEVNDILKRGGIDAPLSRDINCVSQDFNFWGRTEITLVTLSSLEKMNIDYKKYALLGKVFPYIAQSKGLYTGVVYNEEYMNFNSYPADYSLKRLMKMLGKMFGVEDYASLRILESIKYAIRFKDIYIYGAGIVGKKVLSLLQYNGIPVKAFLITDIQNSLVVIDGIPVMQFDQSNIPVDACIIVAVQRSLQGEIDLKIENAVCKNIFHI